MPKLCINSFSNCKYLPGETSKYVLINNNGKPHLNKEHSSVSEMVCVILSRLNFVSTLVQIVSFCEGNKTVTSKYFKLTILNEKNLFQPETSIQLFQE